MNGKGYPNGHASLTVAENLELLGVETHGGDVTRR